MSLHQFIFRTIRMILIGISLIFFQGCNDDKEKIRGIESGNELNEIRRNALNDLKALADENNYKGMGFENFQEIQNCELGKEIKKVNANYDKFKQRYSSIYTYNYSNLSDFINTPTKKIIPVLSGNVCRTTIVMREVNETGNKKLILSEVGNSNYADNFNSAQKIIQADSSISYDDLRIINFPGIITVLGYQDKITSTWKIILSEDYNDSFKKDTIYESDFFVKKLLPEINRNDSLIKNDSTLVF